MADDDQDKSQKTEDPSNKKLENAELEGNIAKSQEINHWFIITGATLGLVLFAGTISSKLMLLLRPFIAEPDLIPADPGNLGAVFRSVALGVGLLLAPLVALMLVASVGGTFVQHPPDISLERLHLDFSRLSPFSGLKGLLSTQGLSNLLKSLLKFAVIGFVVLVLVWPKMVTLPGLVSVDIAQSMHITRGIVVSMLIAIIAIMGVVAGLDFVYQKWDHVRNLRMSKQELRDEAKQNDGDPMIKARLRSIRVERSRRRMMAAVPTADVVVTNPTHYAVALKYDGATMPAPKVVAKGQDLVALRIRELAFENKIPVVENPPLARALHAACEIDQEIPVEHYQAVAEIIGYVMRLKGKLAARRAGV